MPSLLKIFIKPAVAEGAKGVGLVCILTFRASHGQRAMSAMNSADAEALEIQQRSILEVFPSKIRECLFKIFIKSKFTGSLRGVPNQRWNASSK